MTISIDWPGVRTINPANALPIDFFPFTSEAELNETLDRSRVTQAAWRHSSLDERAVRIRALAALLRLRREELATQIVLEMGKPVTQALAEIDKCAWTCDHYADELPRMMAPREVDVAPDTASVHVRPLGVVLAILPWNYPWWQVVRAMLPAIAAGNTVVLKHADSVSGCALSIAGAFRSAFDVPVLQAVILPPERTEALIADSRIDAVTFTGSERIGAFVAGAAGRVLKKCVLELGGSDPLVVMEDADVERAAAAAVKSRFLNNGQSCIAAKRLIVHEAVHVEFFARLEQHMRGLKVGDPTDPETDIGPIARVDLRDALVGQQQRAITAGATVVASVAAPQIAGSWFSPTLIRVESGQSVLFEEETFGPLGAISVVADEASAVDLANRSRYGLSSSVWTGDVARGHAIAGRLDTGSVFINSISASDPRLPVGGVKASGYGRELGEWGLMEFANIQAVRVGHAS